MTTLVGTQKDLNDLLESLIELDLDAIEAYDAAIDRLSDAASKAKLTEFKADHVRHTQELGKVLAGSGRNIPTRADAKGLLAKGKVVLAGLVGDKAVLKAMKTNEDDTNTAYERAVAHEGTPASVSALFRTALDDERRHRAWIEAAISAM
jgi:rubrerythrin